MTENRTSDIFQAIAQLEKEKDVRVLLAVESGSRAWGFPSPDSDFDVRFIYTRPLASYLQVYEPDDFVDLPIDEDLDLGGWELRKALRLATRGNVTVFEWLQSPIVYREAPGFREQALELIRPLFSPISATHHYLSLARSGVEAMQESETIRGKKFFYTLRSVLAAAWIRKHSAPPPVPLDPLMDAHEPPFALISEISKVREEKSRQDEKWQFRPGVELKDWICKLHEELLENADSLPAGKKYGPELDTFLYQVIQNSK